MASQNTVKSYTFIGIDKFPMRAKIESPRHNIVKSKSKLLQGLLTLILLSLLILTCVLKLLLSLIDKTIHLI